MSSDSALWWSRPSGPPVVIRRRVDVTRHRVRMNELQFHRHDGCGFRSLPFSSNGLTEGTREGASAVWRRPKGRRTERAKRHGEFSSSTLAFGRELAADVSKRWRKLTKESGWSLAHLPIVQINEESFSPRFKNEFVAIVDGAT